MMKTKSSISLAYSSCPNDTFIFKAMARQLIDLSGYCFHISVEDVETLNQKAAKCIYDITKLSFAALGSLLDRYALLRTGAALGKGCGPLLISLPGRSFSDKKKWVVAVPGLGTTACHLLRFYMDDILPGQPYSLVPMPFETVMPSVLEGRADLGVIIHEGRFVYASLGLEMKADLGEWWEKKTSLPIPLGCIAIRRDMDPGIARDVEILIGQSIDHAYSNPGLAYDYIREHAQELEESVIEQHIRLYVNEFSRQIGTAGEEAVISFFEKGRAAGFIPRSPFSLFAC